MAKTFTKEGNESVVYVNIYVRSTSATDAALVTDFLVSLCRRRRRRQNSWWRNCSSSGSCHSCHNLCMYSRPRGTVAPFGTGLSRLKNISCVFGGEVIRFIHAGDEALTIPSNFDINDPETKWVQDKFVPYLFRNKRVIWNYSSILSNFLA